MLCPGLSKSLIEPYWSTVLWVFFILKIPAKLTISGYQPEISRISKIRSERKTKNMCVWLKPVRIYNHGAVSRVQPPRSRSSTGKTKKKLKFNRSPTVWTTGVHSAAFDWVLVFLRSHPSSFGSVNCSWHLIGVWVRGFPSALADGFFLCGWPPVSCFRNETLTAFVFCVMFASIIKNRPVRGGFFLQLDLCGPNSKLCRWYRTFFEILLRISAFFALVRCKFPSEFGTLHREHGKMHSVEVGKELWVKHTRFRQLRTFSCDGGRSARPGFFQDLVLIALRVRVNYYSVRENGEIPGWSCQ